MQICSCQKFETAKPLSVRERTKNTAGKKLKRQNPEVLEKKRTKNTAGKN